MVVALVDVQTVFRPGYKPVTAFALVVDAHLVVVATDVGSAAHLAHPVDAQLPRQTVAVAVAQLHAYSVLATFALGTVARLAALALAESGHAQVLTGAILGTLAYVRHSDAALLGRGIPVEAEGTGAGGRVIGDATDRVWPANVLPFARILTLVVNAGLRGRTILVASTSQDTCSVHASLVRLTLRMGDAWNHALVARALFTR